MSTETGTIVHRERLASSVNSTDVPVSKTVWDDSELMQGGHDGGLVVRDSSQTDGWGWLRAVAAGQVLVSVTADGLPAWSAAPTVTTLVAATSVSSPLFKSTGTVVFGQSAQISELIGSVVRFRNSNGLVWYIDNDTPNAILPTSDNSYDIGQTANRVRSAYVGTALIVGTNPSGSGAARFANAAALTWRNAANDGNIEGIRVNSSNYVHVDAGGNGTQFGSGSATAQLTSNGGRDFQFGTNGTTYWGVSNGASGILYAVTDNATDIGATGANRPRSIYAGTSVVIGATTLNGTTADLLEQFDGTTAQTYAIYNTRTSSTNYERGELLWSGNKFFVGTRKGSGGGTARELHFFVDGIDKWFLDTSGNLGPVVAADNGVDLGSATARTRSVYAGTALVVGANPSTTGGVRLANASVIASRDSTNAFDLNIAGMEASNNIFFGDNSNGRMAVLYGARFGIGGTSSSFPALKRSTTALHVRLADDSGFAPLQAAAITANGDGYVSGRFDAAGIFVLGGNGDVFLYRSGAKALKIDADGAGAALNALAVVGPFSATTYSVGATAGIDASITSAGLVGKTITVSKGIVTGFA